MSDLQWCTSCDKAISPYSDSLYCSEECLRQDAISHHPMLGYEFPELQDFPRRTSLTPSMLTLSPALSSVSTMSSLAAQTPNLSPVPSAFNLDAFMCSSLSEDVLHLDPVHSNIDTNKSTRPVTPPQASIRAQCQQQQSSLLQQQQQQQQHQPLLHQQAAEPHPQPPFQRAFFI
ncbi:hypothetical protein BC940DRAFT_295010 [Gongronella butleri]|nr:hypothetical protein BC940DRAFT_295010 [Gongronella butleri]